jgi:hypothetical protein
LLENWRIVRQVPKSGKRIERPRPAHEIVVVLIFTYLRAPLDAMLADYLIYSVTKLDRVLGEDRSWLGVTTAL